MATELSKKDKRDVLSVMIFGAIAAVAVIVIAINDIAGMFSLQGFVVTARFPGVDAALPAPVSAGTEPLVLDASITEARFLAPDIPLLSAAGFVAAVVFLTLTYIVVIACVLGVSRNLIRGRAFASSNSRYIFTASITLFVGTLLAYMGTTFGINGAFASVGYLGNASQANMPASYWPSLFLAIALSVIAIAFRAGERLQRDTEGLV